MRPAGDVGPYLGNFVCFPAISPFALFAIFCQKPDCRSVFRIRVYSIDSRSETMRRTRGRGLALLTREMTDREFSLFTRIIQSLPIAGFNRR